MLEKIISVDLIEVFESGTIQVRTKTTILEDNVEISSKFHRHVIAPGDDYSTETVRVQAICETTHTSEVISTYKTSLVKA